MKRKRITAILIACIFLFPSLIGFATPISETNLLRDRTPNWSTRSLGERETSLTIPNRAPETRGFYSTAISSQTDYSQSRADFESIVMQYTHDGFIEVFHEEGQTTPVSYATVSTNQSTFLESNFTGVDAFDQYNIKTLTGLDISHGQWLINNDIFARFNQKIEVQNGTLGISKLNEAPWGISSSTTAMTRDEFVVSMAKAAYGTIESRPILIPVNAVRHARAGFWWEVWSYVHTWDSFSNPITIWNFAGWEWQEEEDPQGSLPRNRGNQENVVGLESERRINNFWYQQVNNTVNSGHVLTSDSAIHSGPSVPSDFPQPRRQSYQVSGHVNWGWNDNQLSDHRIIRHHWRGEFITNPEVVTSSILQYHQEDAWVYVSSNVWELYIFKLLSEGILDYDELFNLRDEQERAILTEFRPDLNLGPMGDTFNIRPLLDNLEAEFKEYGLSQEDGTGRIGVFPAYAPELGIVVKGSPQSVRDSNISVTLNTSRVLGRNYIVNDRGTSIKWDSEEKSLRQSLGLPRQEYFANQTMTVISALRLIERIMRVQENNMSALEASIISQKYGAKFLDNIPEDDRKTVQFLIALGIIDFENFEEYSNLYSILTREFAYTLVYRYANPAARTHFSKLLLTDASSFDISNGLLNYQNQILTNAPGALDRFITQDGRLAHNAITDSNNEFGIMSSVYVDHIRLPGGYISSTTGEREENPIFIVTVNIDDPLKYLYRNLPLVLHEFSYVNQMTNDGRNTIVPDDFNEDDLYLSEKYASVPENQRRARIFREHKTYWNNNRDDGIYLAVYPDNMFGGRDARIAATVAGFREHIGGSNVRMRWQPSDADIHTLDYRYPNTNPWHYYVEEGQFGRVTSEDISDPSGIMSVRVDDNSRDRYLVEIAIAAVNESSAVNFVKANMVPLTEGLLANTSELTSAVVQNTNTLVVDSRMSPLTNNILIDNDLILGSSGLAVRNSNCGISGAQIMTGTMETTLNNTSLISADMLKSFSRNSSMDSVGQLNTVAVNAPALNNPDTIKWSSAAQGSTKVYSREFRVTNEETEEARTERFVDISNGKFGDIFTATKEVMISHELVDPKITRARTLAANLTHDLPVSVNIVLEFNLELPNPSEQNLLVTNHDPMVPRPRASNMNNWIYTRSETIAELQDFWDYNIAVSNAILNTMGISDSPIRSGYLVPSLTFLADWKPGAGTSEEIVSRELRKLQNDFLIEVGSHLPIEWINKFIGLPVVSNMTIDAIQPNDFTQLESQNNLVRIEQGSDISKTRVNTANQLLKSGVIANDIPIWAGLYFEYSPAEGQIDSTFLHLRQSLPRINSYEIRRHDNAHRLFGEFEPLQGDGEAVVDNGNYDNIRFVLDEHNSLFKNIEEMNYTWQEANQTLRRTPLSFGGIDSVGMTFKLGGVNWIVVHDDGVELSIVSEDFLRGNARNGNLMIDDNMDVRGAMENWVRNKLGSTILPGVPHDAVLSFEPFDTTGLDLFSLVGEVVIEIFGTEMRAHRLDATIDGNIIRVPTTVSEGQSIYFRPFVRLNRAVFNPNVMTNEIEWSRRILGADPRYYNPENNIHLLTTSMIPFDSANLLTASELGTRDFLLGDLVAHQNNDGTTTVKVPFTSNMLDVNGTLNHQELLSALRDNGVPIVVGNNIYSSSDFMNVSGLATYDPEFTGYDGTLVFIGDKIYVVIGNELIPLNIASLVNDVAVIAELDPDLLFLTVRNTMGEVIHAMLHGTQNVAPRLTFTQRNYNVLKMAIPVGNLDNYRSFGPSEVNHFHEHVASLINNFNMLRIKGRIGMVTWFVIILSLVQGVFILLARVLWKNPWTRSWAETILSASGIDVLACISLILVRTSEEEPRSLMHLALIASIVAITPMFIVALIQRFGILI